MKLFFLSFCVLASATILSACVASNPETLTVRTITQDQSAYCTFKGTVYSEAPYYGVFTGTTQDKLIELGKESALRLGATDYLPALPVQKGNKMTMEGKAYVCP